MDTRTEIGMLLCRIPGCNQRPEKPVCAFGQIESYWEKSLS